MGLQCNAALSPSAMWVDSAERYLDEHGLDRPHVAGNSMGGYMAIELARRGRAATVCALSPGGFWSAGDGLQAQILKWFKRSGTMARLTRPLTPRMFKSARLRRLLLRDTVCNGDRLTADRALEMSDDFLVCTALLDILGNAWEIAPLNPLPCPITIAWSEKDVLLPLARYGANVRERLPQATFKTLPEVGHVPMLDDPDLSARTILAVTGAAKS